jgi:hypothetical protein
MHNALKIDTFSSIIHEVSVAHQLKKEEIIQQIFG